MGPQTVPIPNQAIRIAELPLKTRVDKMETAGNPMASGAEPVVEDF